MHDVTTNTPGRQDGLDRPTGRSRYAMGRIGEKVVPGRGRWALVAKPKELPLAMVQYGEARTKCLYAPSDKGLPHQRYLQEENKEAMQEDYSQEGTTERIQIASRFGASKETDTGINRRLSMAGVGEGPVGNCIVGEPESRDGLEGRNGRPDLEWQEPFSTLFTGWTQDSPQSEGTRGKQIGDTYYWTKTNTPLKAGTTTEDAKVPRSTDDSVVGRSLHSSLCGLKWPTLTKAGSRTIASIKPTYSKSPNGEHRWM